MRGQRPVTVARELSERIAGRSMANLLGVGGVLALRSAVGVKDAAHLAECRSAALYGEEARSHEELPPLHQKVTRSALVGDGQEVVGDLCQFGVALLGVLDPRDALEGVVAMRRVLEIERRETEDRSPCAWR